MANDTSKQRWWKKFLPKAPHPQDIGSWIRKVVTGGVYRVSDIRTNSEFADILTQITTMRELTKDSQINTALNYYATDATIPNASGDIIWAVPVDDTLAARTAAQTVNDTFKRWNINAYIREHILELATVGNLYLPTTLMYAESADTTSTHIVLDNNTIPDKSFDIIPSTKVPPESILHFWKEGQPQGYLMNLEAANTKTSLDSGLCLMPESACIHFSLGGLLGDYTYTATDSNGDPITYDIQFATPLLSRAVQPTQTLSLLEDANVLSSLTRTIKFINVRCGTNEAEIEATLTDLKGLIEQQLSLNTATGDSQSYVNPQSPNNFIYVPMVNDSEAISITDLNVAETSDADNKLLEYYQDKKLSVLGVPKEAMNFSSNEGLGGAGSVLSQRSALYANTLQRLETAYISGWADAFNKYFSIRNFSGFVDKFRLHMNTIITPLSTVEQERKDAVLTQASTIIELLKSVGVTDSKEYAEALKEVLIEAFPRMGSTVNSWDMDLTAEEEGGGGMDGF